MKLREHAPEILALAILATLFLVAGRAHATGDHKSPPRIVTVTAHDHDRTAGAALIGAAITYFIMRRHHRRHHSAPPAAACPVAAPSREGAGAATGRAVCDCVPATERVLEACGVSK